MGKRPTSERAARIGICLYPGVWASSASLASDLVHIAASIARARGGRRLEARLLGPGAAEVETASGASMHADAPWEGSLVDAIVLPALALPILAAGRTPPGLETWLVGQHGRGATVLAISTGSALLARTGLLDGHKATTHWGALDLCRATYPAVVWSGEQRLTVANRLVTTRDVAAAATALCHVIGQLTNVSIGERTFQYSLVHEPGAPSLPPLHTLPLRDHGDAQVLSAQEWLEARHAEAVSAAAVARRVGMSPRNLRRRFHEATGLTVSAYLVDVRLARARALLLSTREPVSQIALAVGYEDAASFTALFRRRHGVTPTGYRRAAPSIG